MRLLRRTFVKITCLLVLGLLLVLLLFNRTHKLPDLPDGRLISNRFQWMKVTNSAQKLVSPYRARRYRSAAEYCEDTKGPVTRSMFNEIIVNDKYKLIYCPIAKVACTNWKRIMLTLSGKVNSSKLSGPSVHEESNRHLTYLSSFSEDEIDLRLKTYFKFVFTRNPFERVLSAYRDKFERNNPIFHQSIGKSIVRSYRGKEGREVLKGDDVTFFEFIQYLTDSSRREELNPHWKKMTTYCRPCVIKYDMVSSYNDLEKNSYRILEKIGVSETIKFPKRPQTYKKLKTEDILQRYYREIPTVMLEQFMDVYFSDFLLFNYSLPKTLANLTRLNLQP